MKRIGLRVVLAGSLTSGALAACGADGDGDDGSVPAVDGGRDATPDAMRDSGADAARPVTDAETPVDAGAGTDADADADADAGPLPCTVGAGGAYATIQEAVDAAACAKIHVLPGVSKENVTVGAAVEIQGDDALTTIIDGAETDAGTDAGITVAGITVKNADVTLRNLTVRKAQGGISSTGNLTLLGMIVSGNAGTGITQAGKSRRSS